MIPKLLIETTKCTTELCHLGAEFGTDKSPLNTVMAHRHPYTAVYSMLFAPLKNKPIHFAEIGIAGASSVKMWRRYFTQATLSFFDCDRRSVEFLKSLNVPLMNFE